MLARNLRPLQYCPGMGLYVYRRNTRNHSCCILYDCTYPDAGAALSGYRDMGCGGVGARRLRGSHWEQSHLWRCPPHCVGLHHDRGVDARVLWSSWHVETYSGYRKFSRKFSLSIELCQVWRFFYHVIIRLNIISSLQYAVAVGIIIAIEIAAAILAFVFTDTAVRRETIALLLILSKYLLCCSLSLFFLFVSLTYTLTACNCCCV